ncbi:MAG: NUMOD4 domain-containing protein, partial [Bacteroidota bacterium]
MEEKWKQIENYEGFYEVSNLGKVKSLNRCIIYSNGKKSNHKGKILKQKKSDNGYLRVELSKNNKQK